MHEIRVRRFGNDGIQVFCKCQCGAKGMLLRKGQRPFAEFNIESSTKQLVAAFQEHVWDTSR